MHKCIERERAREREHHVSLLFSSSVDPVDHIDPSFLAHDHSCIQKVCYDLHVRNRCFSKQS